MNHTDNEQVVEWLEEDGLGVVPAGKVPWYYHGTTMVYHGIPWYKCSTTQMYHGIPQQVP